MSARQPLSVASPRSSGSSKTHHGARPTRWPPSVRGGGRYDEAPVGSGSNGCAPYGRAADALTNAARA